MWRNMAFKRITNIDRLGLLLWKNYRLVIRTRTKVFALIAIPVCFAMTFLIIKMAMPMSEKDHRTYVGFNITASPVRPAGSHLAFISNNFKNASLIMEEVERILDLNTSLEFFDDNDMVSYLRYDSLGLGIGGVIFRKDGAKLTVVIRDPLEVRGRRHGRPHTWLRPNWLHVHSECRFHRLLGLYGEQHKDS